MKDCLIIGPASAFHYDETFNLLKDNILRPGHKGYLQELSFWFLDGEGKRHRIASTFFTTLQVKDRERHFTPTKTYNKEDYPQYDNYNAIECRFKNNLPIDYEGLIGIPESFWFYYPELDYEVIEHLGDLKLNGKQLYERLIVRKRCLVSKNNNKINN